MPEGAHPLPEDDILPRGRGWSGIPFVEIDGQSWPLEFASKMLEIPLKDLQHLVRITGLKPSGVIRMAEFRRQGRQPRAFPADKLILLSEGIRELSAHMS
jgi:hypothetical protein